MLHKIPEQPCFALSPEPAIGQNPDPHARMPGGLPGNRALLWTLSVRQTERLEDAVVTLIDVPGLFSSLSGSHRALS
jgi:hypothetical protein